MSVVEVVDHTYKTKRPLENVYTQMLVADDLIQVFETGLTRSEFQDLPLADAGDGTTQTGGETQGDWPYKFRELTEEFAITPAVALPTGGTGGDTGGTTTTTLTTETTVAFCLSGLAVLIHLVFIVWVYRRRDPEATKKSWLKVFGFGGTFLASVLLFFSIFFWDNSEISIGLGAAAAVVALVSIVAYWKGFPPPANQHQSTPPPLQQINS